MSAISKEDKKYHVLLFLFSPVLGLINSLRTKDLKTIRWGLFSFTVIHGSLYHISFGGDGADHLRKVYEYQYRGFDVFWNQLIDIFLFQPQDTSPDPYIHIVAYLMAGVLNAPRFFFVPISIVYAYFYSGALIKLLSYVNLRSPNNKIFVYSFLIFLLLMISPAEIQYIRSTTGFWVLLYALVSYHQTKKKKYIFLVFLPGFIHIGYLVLAIPAWFILISGFRFPKLYFIVFMVSMLAADVVDQGKANELASQTAVGESKVKGYTVDETKKLSIKHKKMQESATFYRAFQSARIQNYVYAAIVIFIFVFLNKKGFGDFENSLFCYAMGTGTLANFLSFNYAIYNRGWQISGYFIITLLLIFLSKNNLKNIRLSFLKVKLPLVSFVVLLIPNLLYQLSNFLSFTSPYVFILPVVNWIEYDFGIDIRAVIGVFM